MSTNSIDLERIRDAADGDVEFLRELVAVYLDDASAKIREISSAVQRRDALDLGRMAHSLKGSSANVGANKISALAKQIEQLGKANRIQDAEPLVQGLEQELIRVTTELQTVIA